MIDPDCSICGRNGCVTDCVESRKFEYMGKSTVVNMYFQKCSRCGSEYVDQPRSVKNVLAVNNAKASIDKQIKHPTRYVVMDDKENYYHFWDKGTYDMPQWGDAYWAKVMTPQGAASAMRRLKSLGYTVHRVLWTPEMGTRESRI